MRVLSLLALSATTLLSGAAHAEKAKVHFDSEWQKHPSAQYGALSQRDCLAELNRRGIAFTPVKSAPGVLAPVRLPKDVGGVSYRTEAPPQMRGKSPFDVFDCRVVLALSDFSKILAAHDVSEALIFSAWRPPPKSWPEGSIATRHPGALAVDVRKLVGRSGRVLDVEKDFHGTLGATVCGPGAKAPSPETADAKELRSIVCEAADQHLFTTILTPNYNFEHRNHVHLEVTPDVKWSLLR